MNPENLKPFKKGYDERRENNGRKPKVYTVLKEMGFGNDDIIACFKEIMWYSITELKEIAKDEEQIAIKGIMAKSLVEDWKKGNLNNTREFLMRLMGAPTQKHEVDNKQPMIVFKDSQKDAVDKIGDL